MRSESFAKTALVLFCLALIPCMLIAHHSIMSHAVNESALVIEAENFAQAIVTAEQPPITFDEYFDFLGEHPMQFRDTMYGEAQRPGDIGFQPLMDDAGAYGYRITVMGNDRIIYDRSFDF